MFQTFFKENEVKTCYFNNQEDLLRGEPGQAHFGGSLPCLQGLKVTSRALLFPWCVLVLLEAVAANALSIHLLKDLGMGE